MEQAASPAIDFQKMLKEEKQKSKEKLTLKVSSITNTYNMLQDLRHILILDFRSPEEFEEANIRRSINVNLENYQHALMGLFATKPQDHASHYISDDLKRVLFVLPKDDWKNYEKKLSQEIEQLGNEVMNAYMERIGKAYFFKDFPEFRQKYKFMCVGQGTSYKQKIRSICRYPSEIKENLIYIGNMMNVIDKSNFQVSSLGFKTIIYISSQKFDHLHELPNMNVLHFEAHEPSKPQIDFDAIIQQVLTLISTKEQTPILIFDVSGILSAAVGVKIMLETNKAWSKEIAMAYIINKRYEAKDMPSWLYSQILLGGQKKVKSEPLPMDGINNGQSLE
eukprot:403333809